MKTRIARSILSSCGILLLASHAPAQITNIWKLNGSGFWSYTNNWYDINSYPNSAGAVALVTNNTTSDQFIFLTNSITLGTLIFGDYDRGSYRALRSTNATVSTITFDTGDGNVALFEHGTGDLPARDIGRYDDYTDAGIVVSDPDGLFIDNWANFAFYGNGTGWDPSPARAFDGGGNNVTKGEDGALYFRRIVTNIATFYQRDGFVEFNPEGQPVYMPGISNLVLGVAPGTVDTGGNPYGVTTNLNEGTASDRIQFPYFSILGAATTNNGVAMTNAMHVTMNRGVFRTLDRGVLGYEMSNATKAVYTGNFTLNGSADENFFIIEHSTWPNAAYNVTSAVRQTIFDGTFTGSGGFTKMGTGEMLFTGSNDFTGAVNINRGSDSGRGRWGGIGLRENGIFSGASQVTLNRDGQLYLDNSSVNLSNRLNDAAAITSRGRSQIELMANDSAASYERFGAVTTAQGSLAIEIDKADGSPQQQTLEIASLVRAPGSVIGFHASDLQQGAFGLNGSTGIVVNLLDGGASLAQVGAGGTAGAVNRSVAVGVFGGDGVDYGLTNMYQWSTMTPNRADEFMTVDGNRLRTLDPGTEMVGLGGRSTNALFISQTSAGANDNVNIDFASTFNIYHVFALTNQLSMYADKRVVGDTTFNSIRLGIVRGDPYVFGGLTNQPNDYGRVLLIDDGVTLRSESGMLLMGRDTGSTNGDLTPYTTYINGGKVDLDGAANNREGIIHNSSGSTLYMRTSIDASQGFTKSGIDGLVLEERNNFGGVVSVPQGSLYVRDSDALRGASEIRIEGDGQLVMNYGVAITNINLRAGERPWGGSVLYSETGHNVFGGDIMIENVDPQGVIMHDVRLRPVVNGQTATLTLLGDIGLAESGASADLNINDSQILYLIESGGIYNFKGTVGDRIVNGEAVPFDPGAQPRVSAGYMSNRAANENFVLRTFIDGNGGANSGDELVVNIYNPWNAAGRLHLFEGTTRFLGDPAQGKGDFWTTNALAVSDFANGNSGFQMAGWGSGNNESVTLLLTKNGQTFNAERWTVYTDNNSSNTVTIGLEHFGPSNATVTIGNNWNDINPATDDNRIYIGGGSITTPRELRFFSHDGYDSATGSNSVGTVEVIQSIRGNDFSILTTVGNGRVILGGQSVSNASFDEHNDIRAFMLLGGELVLDRSDAYATGVHRTADTRAALTLGGGDLTLLGRNENIPEILNSNLTVKAGDSTISVVAGSGNTTTLLLATNANAVVTREHGGTVEFVEDGSAGGTASIRFGGSGFGVGRIGSWATFATNYGAGAYTWAARDSLSNVVEFAEAGYSVNTFGSGVHTHLDGVPPVPVADETTASLRYTNATALDMGGFSLDVAEGGILVTPTVAGTASIDNGALTSSGGELIIHNYADPAGGFSISAAITGNVDLTFSGTGKTVLSGANTFDGVTRINGGTVQIDDASHLGSTVSNLEFRGGTLFTTANTTLTNRTIILGGEGGTFQVAAGTTNFIANVLSETNFLGTARLNNGVGDLVKTGDGVLNLGTTAGSTNNLIAGYNMIQGLVDVREGTLRVLSTNNNGLGSSKSFYDGTIVRSGATLSVGNIDPMSYTNNKYTAALQEWLMFEQGSTFRVEKVFATWQGLSANGVMDFRGDTTVDIVTGDYTFNSSAAGYIMGSGDIIKDGDGGLNIQEYSPDYTGDIVVKRGAFRLRGYRNNPLPNAGTIYLGLNDITNRSTVNFSLYMDRDGNASTWDVDQNIVVSGRSDSTRIGTYQPNHNDVANFNGDIDLTNFATPGSTLEFRLYVEDTVDSLVVNGADNSEGALREESFINLNGDITGGDKRIRTIVQQNWWSPTIYAQSMDKGVNMGATNEMNMMVFFTFAGTNTGWTGSLEVGNRGGTAVATDGPDQDKQHFMRFGKNDGAVTLAIGPSNSVVLRHDATLQAYGSQVTIGNLFSDGNYQTGTGQDGYFGQQLVTNSFLENGGTFAGSFAINQTSNRVFSGVVRDGTYHSPTSTNMAAAALSIIKAGSGVLTFDRSNYYTGTTTIREGLLQIAGSHYGGGLYSVMNGGSLGGTGIIGSAVSVLDGGILAPGLTNDAVVTAGTLNLAAGLTLSNSSILSFDLAGGDGTKGAGINDLVQGIGNLVLDGVLHIEPLGTFAGAGTNDFWTLMTYDGLLTDNGVTLDAASQALLDPGLMFYVFNFENGLTDEIRLGIMVPEPSSWVLLLTGLSVVVLIARKKRHHANS